MGWFSQLVKKVGKMVHMVGFEPATLAFKRLDLTNSAIQVTSGLVVKLGICICNSMCCCAIWDELHK